MKNYILVLLVFGFNLFFVFPNLSSDINDYKSTSQKIKQTKINIRKQTFKNDYKTLRIILIDNTEWTINGIYSEYFKKLLDKKNIGKKIKIYSQNSLLEMEENNNPVQIEVDEKIIYTVKNQLYRNYILLLAEVGLLVFLFYRKRMNINFDFFKRKKTL